MKKVIIFSLAATFLFASCQKEENPLKLDSDLEIMLHIASDGKGASHYILPESTDFDNIPQDPRNPLTTEKVELGKLLYHETGIALAPMKSVSEGTYSCASCHFASAGFQAGRFQGIAEGGTGFGVNGEGRQKAGEYVGDELDVQPVKSPSAMNLAYQEALLWNGQFGALGINSGTDYAWTPGTPIATNELGYEGLETQAIAGLTVHRLDTKLDFLTTTGYKAMYDAAFPDIPEEDRYTQETTGLAIAAFERTMLANKAPFQEWLRGNISAMTDQEKRGALLFFSKGRCSNCHNGPSLSKMEFHAIGMKDLLDCPEETFKTPAGDPAYLGRGGFTGEEEDMYKFKVPQLYNTSDSPFYGHGSSLRSLREVIEYKNLGVPENTNVPANQLAKDFKPLDLTDTEIDDIVAFLENALRDPELARYEPTSLPSGNCFPFADPVAAQDLGCQ